MINILNIFLAALGLGFLIFIHELGHYWMARRMGMTVEVFSIGFGKAFYSWERKGVKWQLCYLPFGGYVRIAGMEKKGYLEPYDVPDGFYGKKPWARIKVAAVGPIVNLVFALLAFCVLWVCGGREKPFSEYTRLIGWVDPCSDLHEAKVRPGDQITELDHKPFTSFHDVLYASMLDETNPNISGFKINYFTGNKIPFSYAFPLPSHLKGMERLQAVLGAFGPAGYLIATDNPLLTAKSPIEENGIQAGDRLVWVDGKCIFSRNELSETINEPKTLVTVKRGAETFVTRVDRVKFSDLRLSGAQKSEIEDWQHDAAIKVRSQDLFFIPYFLTAQNRVVGSLSFLNAQSNEQSPCTEDASPGLLPKDQIIAVDGIGVKTASELLKTLQMRHIQIIVQKEDTRSPLLWKEADRAFACSIDYPALSRIVSTIGSEHPMRESGKLRLLNPIVPKRMSELPLPEEMRARLESVKKGAGEEEKEASESLEKKEETDKLMLGIALRDRMVNYNPSPFVLFTNVFRDTWRTLIALVTGILSPKWLAGPVGMVQVMHHSWSVGVKEALYWLAVISMNLGILNFLPIPVLDGGHICFSLWEAATKKRIKAKTMERLVIPFILLLIALFVYLTYHDIVRLITNVF